MLAATFEMDAQWAQTRSRRRTKIVATLGPASRHERVVESLITSGLDVARINLSYGTPANHEEAIAAMRRAADVRGASLAILLSTDPARAHLQGGRSTSGTLRR